jgi:hypothetical protein
MSSINLPIAVDLHAYFAAHAPDVPDWFDPQGQVERRFFHWRWYYAEQMLKTRPDNHDEAQSRRDKSNAGDDQSFWERS